MKSRLYDVSAVITALITLWTVYSAPFLTTGIWQTIAIVVAVVYTVTKTIHIVLSFQERAAIKELQNDLIKATRELRENHIQETQAALAILESDLSKKDPEAYAKYKELQAKSPFR